MPESSWTYESLKKAVDGKPLPLVLVDLDQFDANVRYFAEAARRANKSVRMASKSVRVPNLLQRALSVGDSSFRGLMCYNAREACYLGSLGFDDLLVAYPTVDPTDLSEVAAATRWGKQIILTVDCHEHIRQLATSWAQFAVNRRLPVCIDVDVSWRPLGAHVGVQRSPLRTVGDFERLLDEVLAAPQLRLAGILAYDAQLAGIPDASPFAAGRNSLMRVMKRFSTRDVERKRSLIRDVIQRKGMSLDFYNGGGTGSFEKAIQDPSLSEVTVGSGLLQSHLFDYYQAGNRPAAFCFALAVTRQPQLDRVTCQGGGFIASGPPHRDRLPIPILPAGLRTEPFEGFGEVQTPLVVPPAWQKKLQIGDPIFFRSAKAGEIAERFNEYYLMSGGTIIEQVPTYRGLGKCFH